MKMFGNLIIFLTLTVLSECQKSKNLIFTPHPEQQLEANTTEPAPTPIPTPSENRTVQILSCIDVCQTCDNNNHCSMNKDCMKQVEVFYRQKIKTEQVLREIPAEETEPENVEPEAENEEIEGAEIEEENEEIEEEEEDDENDECQNTCLINPVSVKRGKSFTSFINPINAKMGKSFTTPDYDSTLKQVIDNSLGSIIDGKKIKIFNSKAKSTLKYVVFAVDSTKIKIGNQNKVDQNTDKPEESASKNLPQDTPTLTTETVQQKGKVISQSMSERSGSLPKSISQKTETEIDNQPSSEAKSLVDPIIPVLDQPINQEQEKTAKSLVNPPNTVLQQPINQENVQNLGNDLNEPSHALETEANLGQSKAKSLINPLLTTKIDFSNVAPADLYPVVIIPVTKENFKLTQK